MSEGIRRMLRERQMLAHNELYRKEVDRIAEVKAAFEEGMNAGLMWSGANPFDGDAAWLLSRTRRLLYHGPPAPTHIRVLNRARRHPVDRGREIIEP